MPYNAARPAEWQLWEAAEQRATADQGLARAERVSQRADPDPSLGRPTTWAHGRRRGDTSSAKPGSQEASLHRGATWLRWVSKRLVLGLHRLEDLLDYTGTTMSSVTAHRSQWF